MALPERLHESTQENLITLLAHSDEYGKLVAQMADAQLFEGDYRVIAERCIDYWNKQGQAPKVHTPDLFSDILEDQHNRKRNTYNRIISQMIQLSDAGINAQYVVQQLKTFTRVQTVKAALYQAAEIIQQPNVEMEQVEQILADILRVRDFQFDPGVTLIDIDRMLNFAETQVREFSMGIPEFDKRNVVPQRGTMMLFLAPKGRGKSWYLTHLSKQALMSRKRVLYISNEMREEPIQQRVYQALFSMSRREGEFEYTTFRRARDNGQVVGFRSEIIKPELDFTNPFIHEELTERIKLFGHRFYENMKIKRFPPHTLTARGLEAYLDSLEATEGFIPDMLLVDNIGNMRTDQRNHRISLGREFTGVIAIAIERNMACVATHQVGRVGMQSEKVRSTHGAEDISMIHSSDFVITYSATEAERNLGLARLFVENARSEEDKFTVLITQNYKIGQFALESAYVNEKYYEMRNKYVKEQGMLEDEEAEDE